jgi:hypothetical protein
MKTQASGQALVEFAFLLIPYITLISAIVAFGQWFVIRHEMIVSVREGALLYSSGRITADETRALMQNSLRKGSPSLIVPDKDIYVGRHSGFQARLFRLDEVRLVYHPTLLMNVWRFKDMQETCVIKHAPSYWQTEIPGANMGPPIPW